MWLAGRGVVLANCVPMARALGQESCLLLEPRLTLCITQSVIHRVLSCVSSLGLYFPFCKMESLIPALPQGDSARSDQIGEAFRNLSSPPVHSCQQPICLQHGLISPCPGAATRPYKVF